VNESGTVKPEKAQKTTALVTLPTRELARQMAQYLEKFRQSSVPSLTFKELVKDVAVATVTEQVVFGTPGTICKFIDLAKKRKIQWDMTGIEWYVMDEADNLLAEGFANETKKIRTALEKAKGKGSYFHQLFVSATFNERVFQMVDKTAGGDLVVLKPGDYLRQSVRTGVEQKRHKVKTPEDRARALALLFPELAKSGGSCLVFLSSGKGADQLNEHITEVNELKKAGLSVDVLTGKKTAAQRDEAFSKFSKGEIKILFATDVMCRGINIPKINFVVHYDLPTKRSGEPDPVVYIHRCGRCARFTNKGVSLAFEVENNPSTSAVLDKLEAQFNKEALEDGVSDIRTFIEPVEIGDVDLRDFE